MKTARRASLHLVAGIAAIVVSASVPAANAQPASGPPNALQGFSQNRDKPVKIDAVSLEVRDKDKVATFSGNVHLVQGDTTLRCNSLVVFYDQEATPAAMKAAQPGPGGQQQIRRLEARGGVVVTQKDQTATGENGVFDMKSNTVTLTGNVVIAQGQNVVKGDRLIVDMTSGVSRVECGKSNQCRVQALIHPGSTRDGNRGGESTTGRATPKPKPAHPTGLY